jgi:hypothetical protein
MTASVKIINNAKVFCDWMDMSGQENEVKLDFQCDELNSEAFNVGAHVVSPGLAKFSCSHKGYMAYGLNSIEEKIAALSGVKDVPMTISQPGNAGDPCYFFKSGQISINRGMQVGQLASFEMAMVPTSLTVLRGTLLENGTAKSTSGQGTARQLPAVAAGQNIYAILHVLDITGGTPTLDVVIESDDAAGMASPVTKVTFTRMTAKGSLFVGPIAGPNTDTYYRAKWTLGSGTTATIAVSVGIL